MTKEQLAKRAVWKSFAQLNQAKAAAFEAFTEDDWPESIVHLEQVIHNSQDTIAKIREWAAVGVKPDCELTAPIKS